MACFPGSLGARPLGQIDRRLSTTAEPFSFHFIPEPHKCERTILRALSPYGCDLTLRKLEPQADKFLDLRPLREVQSLQRDPDDIRAGCGLEVVDSVGQVRNGSPDGL